MVLTHCNFFLHNYTKARSLIIVPSQSRQHILMPYSKVKKKRQHCRPIKISISKNVL